MDDTDTTRLSRRRLLALTAAGSAAAAAGCLGDDDGDAETEAYVAVYHWGYTLFDEDGNEFDQLEVAPDTEVTLHAVNDHAYDAFEDLPDPVAGELEDFDAMGRTRGHVEAGQIESPDDETIEAVYEEAHGGGHDHNGHDDDGHGHDDDGHDDGHGHDDDDHGHEDALLDHGFTISEFDVQAEVEGDADEPATVSFVTDEPGTYEATCHIHCGYGHTYQSREILVVTDE